MIEGDSWYYKNDRYLAMALKWLRRRLERLAERNEYDDAESVENQESSEPSENSEEQEEPVQPEQGSFWSRLIPIFNDTPDSEDAVDKAVLDSSHADISDSYSKPIDDPSQYEDQAWAENEMEAFEADERPPALIALSRALGLNRFERNLLLLCAAMELDARIPDLCARAQGDHSRPYPTFALAMALFNERPLDMLSPLRPLRYWRLIEINQPPAYPLSISPLRADERIVNYIKGLNYLDDRLGSLLTRINVSGELSILPDSQKNVVKVIVRNIGISDSPPPVVQLLGIDGSTKQMIAGYASHELGKMLYYLPIQLIPQQLGEMETFSRLWQRECNLLSLALYLDVHEFDHAQTSAQASFLSRFLDTSPGTFFMDARDRWTDLIRESIVLETAKPKTSEQQAAWSNALGLRSDGIPAKLACQFDLNLSTINQIAQRELHESDGGSLPLEERLWRACRESTRPTLDGLAQPLKPVATCEDIVLPKKEKDLLELIARQVKYRCRVYDKGGFGKKMNRGLGISVLFAGDSGTGKTMAAEALANALKLDLFRIDLSAVVSKYIGETEKNLRRLFDAFEGSGAILFFDEADALFGKRSEVKDSHDRYANIEINYLLQRIEAYRGLAILATNMKNALDPAFMRRLRFIVNFPFPGKDERLKIWKQVFPKETQTENLNFEKLAHFAITGGSIHNIALNAAFLAAPAGVPVSMPMIMDSAKIEFQKMGMRINEADFTLPGSKK